MGWISHQNPSITAFAPFPHLNPRKLLIRRRLLDQTSGFWGNFCCETLASTFAINTTTLSRTRPPDRLGDGR
jgi:hypothetical protein